MLCICTCASRSPHSALHSSSYLSYVGMLHRCFNTWADNNTLHCIYLTCIRPVHLEYACQLRGPHTSSSQIEVAQKFALSERWDIDYDSMMEHSNISPLSVHRQYLKLTIMHNIISGNFYFLLVFLHTIFIASFPGSLPLRIFTRVQEIPACDL